MSDVDDPVEDPGYDLDMAAASLAADGADVQILLRALVERLRDALGERMAVKRKGGLLKKSDEIVSLDIQLAGDSFTTQVQRGQLASTVSRISGGIKIRSESVPVGEWLRRLLGALQDEAAHSATARAALEQIVIGGPT